MAFWETLRKEVFEKVDEKSFSVLYPSYTGRPNSPINQLVTLLTIKELLDWTFRELEESMSAAYPWANPLFHCGQSPISFNL